MSIRKPFNQQLHDENDPKARQAVMKFIRQCGLTAVENENIYGIDLFISGKSSTGHVYNKTPVEVERRECWNNERFPFSTVHIPNSANNQSSVWCGFSLLAYFFHYFSLHVF